MVDQSFTVSDLKKARGKTVSFFVQKNVRDLNSSDHKAYSTTNG